MFDSFKYTTLVNFLHIYTFEIQNSQTQQYVKNLKASLEI